MQQTMPSRGSAINPLINQELEGERSTEQADKELLESAPNAAAKGQAQYFTLWQAFHKVKYAKVEVM